MSVPSGWRPMRDNSRPAAEAFIATPFTKLARTHALSSAGDTLVALALAGSLFFSIDPEAARWRVALYLAFTMAPFAVVAPLIGPMVDRMAGGRRLVVIITALGRAVVCAFMIGHIDSLFLFPEAFAVLVLTKGYHISKSAIVPTVVHSDAELVEANSKLSLISGLVGFVAAIPGGLLQLLGGAKLTVALAAMCFGVASILGFQLPRSTVASEPAGEAELAELRTPTVVVAASAMAVLRGIVGFLTFLIAFSFRDDDVAMAWFGVVLAMSAIGSLAGAAAAPILRRHTREETILTSVVIVSTAVALVAATDGGILGATIMAFAAGLSSSAGKLAFDAIVQRDAPDANRGRSFARFEARFQLVWVAGAFIPVVLSLGETVGFLLLALVAGLTSVTLITGLRHVKRQGTAPEPILAKVARRTDAANRLRDLRQRVRDRRGRGPDGEDGPASEDGSAGELGPGVPPGPAVASGPDVLPGPDVPAPWPWSPALPPPEGDLLPWTPEPPELRPHEEVLAEYGPLWSPPAPVARHEVGAGAECNHVEGERAEGDDERHDQDDYEDDDATRVNPPQDHTPILPLDWGPPEGRGRG